MDTDLEWLALAQGNACTAAESFCNDWDRYYNDRENEMWREMAIEQAQIAEALGRIYDCVAGLTR